MPRTVKPLTPAAVANAKPGKATRKLFDGRGLFLEVRPNGSRYWRFKYRLASGDRYLYLGQFPDVGLAQARKLAQAARDTLANGKDPAAEKAQPKPESFEAVASEWWQRQRRILAPATVEKGEHILGQLLPWLGQRRIDEIEAPELLATLRRIEARGAHELARRARQVASRIFCYGVACGYCKRDPAADLRGALTPVKVTHRAALTAPADVARLLRAIDNYPGAYVVGCALRLLPLVFTRPGELRAAEWSEIDLDRALWVIPAEKMKMRREHLVPLSRQAVEILRELRPLTAAGRYVFPSERSNGRPLSENTLGAGLRMLGFAKDEMTAHGFRTLASTRLHEMGYPPHVIEAQLAHAQKSEVAAAYNRAAYLSERERMMQQWADYLDSLKRGAQVVPLRLS